MDENAGLSPTWMKMPNLPLSIFFLKFWFKLDTNENAGLSPNLGENAEYPLLFICWGQTWPVGQNMLDLSHCYFFPQILVQI